MDVQVPSFLTAGKGKLALNRTPACGRLYWATFIPMRLLLYPALLVKFWLVLDGFPLPERLLVVACQFLLCCFNAGVPACRARRLPAPALLLC